MDKVKLPYRIKKKIPFLAVYTIVSFIMLVISVMCLFSPFLPITKDVFSSTQQTVYMFIGGICTPFFTFFLCYSLLNTFSPSDGIVITEKGFYEKTMADGCVGFISASSIVSLKLFGNKKKQFLGVKIDSTAVENLGKTKRAKQEIFNNVECGMPAVIIRSCDISVPIRDVLNTMLQLYAKPKTDEETVSKDVVSIAETATDDAILEQAPEQDIEQVEFLSIVDDDNELVPSPSSEALDDLPLTMAPEQDTPHITNIDELLSHILNNKNN